MVPLCIVRKLADGQAKFAPCRFKIATFAQHKPQGTTSQRMLWSEFQRRPKFGAGKLQIPFLAQSQSEIVVVAGIGRIEVDRPLETRHRVSKITLIREDLANRQESSRAWVEVSSLLQFSRRLFQVALLTQALRPVVAVPQIQSEIVVSLGKARFSVGHRTKQ